MCSVRFPLVFEFVFRWGILLSRVSFLSAGTTQEILTISRSPVDRGSGIEDVQHCIDISQGQEERILKTASVVGN